MPAENTPGEFRDGGAASRPTVWSGVAAAPARPSVSNGMFR